MSEQYDAYLKKDNGNFRKAYHWIKKSAPEILKEIKGVDYSFLVDFHDDTKTIPDEYDAYDNYLFGRKTKFSEQNKRIAKLAHIHRNPHHWQHWVLLDETLGPTTMEMPYEYIVEMICDWWKHSWEKGDLFEIFDWYNANKNKIKLHKKSRDNVEEILSILETKIIKVRGPRQK